MRKVKRLLRFIPAIAVVIIIYIFSDQTGDRSSNVSSAVISAACGEENAGSVLLTVLVRKAAHFSEYAILGAWVFFGLYSKKSPAGRLFALSVLISALCAAADELHQYFVPGRACMFTDVLIDSAGAAAGTAAAVLLFHLFGKKPPRLP